MFERFILHALCQTLHVAAQVFQGIRALVQRRSHVLVAGVVDNQVHRFAHFRHAIVECVSVLALVGRQRQQHPEALV